MDDRSLTFPFSRQEHGRSAELATEAMKVRPEAFEPYFFRAKAKHAQK